MTAEPSTSRVAASATETSGRRALHIHGAAWTSLAPKLLARLAADPHWMDKLMAAINTQVRAYVDWEVHVVHAARTVLGVTAPRASFAELTKAFETATDRTAMRQHINGSVALAALTLGDHTHSATCHKGPCHPLSHGHSGRRSTHASMLFRTNVQKGRTQEYPFWVGVGTHACGHVLIRAPALQASAAFRPGREPRLTRWGSLGTPFWRGEGEERNL